MNKKAIQLNVVFTIKILAVLLVGMLAMSKGMAFAKKDTIFKTNIADDIKMMVDTLVGVPGDAVVQYPSDVSKFTFILDKNGISVYIKEEGVINKIQRVFFLPENYDAFGTLEEKKELCLEKKGKKVLLRGCDVTLEVEGVTFFGITIEENPVVFVMDHSFSMKEDSDWVFPQGVTPPGSSKMAVATWQLKQALQGMEDGVEFNIVYFSSGSKKFKSGLVKLNDAEREEAFEFIDTFEPDTTTNTGEAVAKALSLGEIEGVYLLSDGRPNIAAVALAEIEKANRADKAKINTVGIFKKVPENAKQITINQLAEERAQAINFLRQVADDSSGRFVTNE
jgi:hypothetical protein